MVTVFFASVAIRIIEKTYLLRVLQLLLCEWLKKVVFTAFFAAVAMRMAQTTYIYCVFCSSCYANCSKCLYLQRVLQNLLYERLKKLIFTVICAIIVTRIPRKAYIY